MEKLLLNTFPGLTLSDRQTNLFQDVYVERVVVEQDKNRVSIKLVSNHVIPYREMIRLEDNIGRAFAPTGYEVTVEDRFRLSDQYTPEIFWKEYRDSILLQLKEEDILQFNMFYHGESHVEEGTLYLCCDDDSLFRARETEVIQKIQRIFKTKAGFEIGMEIRYQEPEERKEEKNTRVLYRSTPSGIREVSAGEVNNGFSTDSGQAGMA
ncbi:MAG: hypothetical protein K2J67_02600, partial [Lachnospiraceae bacterium]|nr:hypothetical protein [Lachnospiraceae bacterium]